MGIRAPLCARRFLKMEYAIKQKILLRLGRLIFGLFLCSAGIALTIKANIGYGPWEVFHSGLGQTVGLTIGTAVILVGFTIIVIIVLMGEKIGLGTIFNMLLIGMFLDLILWSGVIPAVKNVYIGLLVLMAGLYALSIGTYFYIGSGFGAGPRDGLMLVLARRTKLSVGLVRSIIELTATLLGWLLGGMVGIGTVLYGVAIGFCINSTFRFLKFNPTEIRHATLMETYREIAAVVKSK